MNAVKNIHSINGLAHSSVETASGVGFSGLDYGKASSVSKLLANLTCLFFLFLAGERGFGCQLQMREAGVRALRESCILIGSEGCKNSRSFLAEHRREHQVVLTMTTSPARLLNPPFPWLPFLEPQLSGEPGQPRVDLQHFDSFVLNIPDKFLRSELPYSVERMRELRAISNRLRINRFGNDLGPISKIVPTARLITDPEAIIVSIDDDIEYPDGFVLSLASRVVAWDCVVGGAGMPRHFWSLQDLPWPQSAPPLRNFNEEVREVDIIEGFGAIAYKRKHLDVDLLLKLSQADPACLVSDDLVISLALAIGKTRKVRAEYSTVFRPRLVLEKGLGEDALHNGAGLAVFDGSDVNKDKYQRCLKAISGKWPELFSE